VQDIAWFVPHQANQRIIDSVARRLGLSAEQIIINLQHYGNVSNASIPIALAEAAISGSFQAGQNILLAGFGGGLTWGAGLVQW
jgi:3-oxoacyl-[acyl-carrier-protein] synthase-3